MQLEKVVCMQGRGAVNATAKTPLLSLACPALPCIPPALPAAEAKKGGGAAAAEAGAPAGAGAAAFDMSETKK